MQAGQVLLQLSAADYKDQLKQDNAELTIETHSSLRDQDLLNHAKNNLALQKQEEQSLTK